MNGKDLLLGMSFISEELIAEADSQPIRKLIPLKKWLPLAACLCLIIGAAGLFGGLIPGMDNGMPESAVMDNEFAAGGQGASTEAAQENGAIWNFATASPAPAVSPGSADTFTYGDSLPESTDSLQLYTEKAELVLHRFKAITVGNTMYLPDSLESTWISGTEVQLFSADNGTLLAQFVIPCNETEYLLVTAVSDSLAKDHFLQAVTEIIEEQEVLP